MGVRYTQLGMCQTFPSRHYPSFQCITIRLIASAPWYITNETLHNDLRIPTVDQLAKLYYNRFHSKLQHHPIPLVTHLASRTLPDHHADLKVIGAVTY
ncbi:zinc finger MYM-type protein 6-like [Aphis craccivora]|uniref:Zinc finger MYM-type protein 6-like n=1 Tax=Aphis craccivora TaxID=307492 RepID=A0A6G0Z1N8_APHCR|nr:zinc finger MYM-type protein 6-like [Aphis craccivora]